MFIVDFNIHMCVCVCVCTWRSTLNIKGKLNVIVDTL